MEATEVGGLRITYERAGTGPPLVLLHGYVGAGRPSITSSTASATSSR
jgi:hypothetical protein